MDQGRVRRTRCWRESDRRSEDRRFQGHHYSCKTIHRENPQRPGRIKIMNKKIVTFGEIMLRLASPGTERFLQTPRFEATFGGGEANVAIALASFGLPAAFVTAL